MDDEEVSVPVAATSQGRRPRWLIAVAALAVAAGIVYVLKREPSPASPSPWPAALATWGADAVGDEKDEATGWPKRIRRTVDGAEMVLIPAGTFQMGAVPGDTYATDDEKPRHAVTLTKAYYLDVHEVTNGQFQRFVTATGHKTTAETSGRAPRLKSDGTDEHTTDATWARPSPDGGRPSDFSKHPVVLVSWHDADAYLRWTNAGRADGFALPTGAQFERAIRGGRDGESYPWGPHLPAPDDAGNYMGEEFKRAYPKTTYPVTEGQADPYPLTAPVRSFAANSYGVHDLSGNVWEWCADWYQRDYYARSPAQDPAGPISGAKRVLRGLCWKYEAKYARASDHVGLAPESVNTYSGFRCARSLP